jgi:hypothetical protein
LLSSFLLLLGDFRAVQHEYRQRAHVVKGNYETATPSLLITPDGRYLIYVEADMRTCYLLKRMARKKQERRPDPIASAMARRRWDKMTETERKAAGRKLTDARLKLQAEAAKSKPRTPGKRPKAK